MCGFLIIAQEPWGGHSPVGGDSLLVTQAGGGSCTRSGELKLRRKEEDCGKREQREGRRPSQPAESLSFPGPQDHAAGGTSLGGAPTASQPHTAPTHRLAWALLAGDLLRAPEMDADLARLTPQTLLGVSWGQFGFNKKD